MDRLSSLMVRASLLWLVAGFGIGALMLADRLLPGHWTLWFAPTHGHMLFVGWFLQFAVGVGYWLLPRRRSPARPLGYDEGPGFAAAAALNLGLLLRAIAEPLERAGHASDVTLAALVVSATLQLLAVATFAFQLWPRVGARPTRRAEASTS